MIALCDPRNSVDRCQGLSQYFDRSESRADILGDTKQISGRLAPFSTDPNTDRRRMWWRRQTALSASRTVNNGSVMGASAPLVALAPAFEQSVLRRARSKYGAPGHGGSFCARGDPAQKKRRGPLPAVPGAIMVELL
jgi:hypothetical protein